LNLPSRPGPNHDGGKVTVSPNGYVYTVVGDLNRNGKAQNFENGPGADATGGILRVTRDGNTLGTGILGTTHPLNKYVAYGIRNSFGMDFDPLTGNLWNTENGPAANDEINKVFGGFNSGWEDIMGVAPAGFNLNNLESFGGKGIYSQPEFVWREVVAPTAIEFLTSTRLGTQYQNDMFVADFNNGRVYDFNLNSQRSALLLGGALSDGIANMDAETQSVIFGEGFGGISDLKVGMGDGYLYVLSISGGALYRIVPNV
jgi:glucose/arabinose dehydrogenase